MRRSKEDILNGTYLYGERFCLKYDSVQLYQSSRELVRKALDSVGITPIIRFMVGATCHLSGGYRVSIF